MVRTPRTNQAQTRNYLSAIGINFPTPSHGKVEELISYNQLLEHLETSQDNDLGVDQELLKLRAIIGHQVPLAATDPD